MVCWNVFLSKERIEQVHTQNPSSLNLSMLMKAFNIPCTVLVGSVTRTDNKLRQGRMFLIKRVCMVALQTTFPYCSCRWFEQQEKIAFPNRIL
eukprot:scaffold9308_cov115-Cylindrotheca_fusiformis.AAC.2